jgi:hypothetical protein
MGGFPASVAAPIEMNRVAAKLQPQTNLPIWMPNAISKIKQDYISLTTQPGSCATSFDYTSDCNGATYCNYGYFTAVSNGQFFTPDNLLNLVDRDGIQLCAFVLQTGSSILQHLFGSQRCHL